MEPIFWIVFVVVLIAGFLGTNLLKNSIFNKLLKNLQLQQFDEFMKRLDSFSCRYFFPPFNREYMRLNAYFLMADETKIKEQFDTLLHMRMNKKQDVDVSMKAFYFYLDEGNKRMVHEMLKRIHLKGSEEFYNQCRIMSDILLDKSTKYIDMMEEQVGKCEGIDRGMYHYMLALQYSYLGEHKKETWHLQRASVDLKDTPYEIKINKLLKEDKKKKKEAKKEQAEEKEPAAKEKDASVEEEKQQEEESE